MTVRFGEKLKIELYGSSHGPCVGVRIEGLPAGRIIDVQRLQEFLDRRAPGRNAWSTPRKEADRPVLADQIFSRLMVTPFSAGVGIFTPLMVRSVIVAIMPPYTSPARG